jgi:hypothetical protein
VPITVKVPFAPVIVPTLELPSPQSIVAINRPGGVAAFASVNLATGPVNDDLKSGVKTTPWGESTSGCGSVWALTDRLAAELPALETAWTQ